MNWLTLVAFSAAGASGALDSRGAKTPPPPPAVVHTVAAAPGAAATTPPAEEPEVQLDGVVVKRPSGGYLQVKMEGVRMILRFYDQKKKPVKSEFETALVVVSPAGRRPDRYVFATSEDGMSMTQGKPIHAPFVFHVSISFAKAGSEASVESYHIQYP